MLDAEPQVFQVGINCADAVKLTGTCAAEEAVRRAPEAGRYLLTEVVATGPAMFDTARLDRARGVQNSDPDAPLTSDTVSEFLIREGCDLRVCVPEPAVWGTRRVGSCGVAS